ncbi:nmrA-like family protein [Sarocladium implicatum]|nr:nmrA-like family protein [Sarocladium implicatum]
MTRIAIAGGSGNVAREVCDVLVARGHEIVLLSRKKIEAAQLAPGVTSVEADYANEAQLVSALTGVHTVLCFITSQSDPGGVSQKALIQATIKAGVKRYAPSEWGTSGADHMPWFDGKVEIRQYLADLNKDKKVIEYCLFQVGLFINYMAAPYKTAKYVHPMQLSFDFNERRAIVVDSTEGKPINFLTVKDFSETVARAVEYEGEWPVVGGIRGDEITANELIQLGEKIRGPFKVEKVSIENLKQKNVQTSWLPMLDHPTIPIETRAKMAAGMVSGMLLGIHDGAFKVTDEWNKLLDLNFERSEDFLTEFWKGKP